MDKPTTTGATLSFRDLTIHVPITTDSFFGLIRRRTGEHKPILNNVSGLATPGTLTMIMGPSGSGKSTLLDTLAGRMSLPHTGQILLDARKRHPDDFRRRAKFVPQDDLLHPYQTTREVLITAARFYGGYPGAVERADAVMHRLGLAGQADVKVGGLFARGLSGGQKRRLSIGVELLASPDLLMLDEPTTGLDSAAALAVVEITKQAAKADGSTVVMSIHQPNREVLTCSDNLILMSRGRVAFAGPTAEALPYFESMGYSVEPGQSASEFMLDLVNADYRDPDEVDQLLDAWDSSPRTEALNAKIDALDADDFVKTTAVTRSSATWVTDFTTNLLRGMRETLRHPAIIWARFVLYVALAIIIGTVWLRLDRVSDQVYEFMTSSAYALCFFAFMTVAAIPAYLEEKHITVREYANGAYSASSFVTSHFLVTPLFLLIISFSASSIVYWLANFRPEAGAYLFYIFVIFQALVAAESVVYLLSLIFDYYIIAVGAGAMLYAFGMAVMGGMIRERNISWVVRWARYPSLHYWALLALHISQLRGETFPASGDDTMDLQGDFVLDVFGFTSGFSQWHGVLALAIAPLLLRLAAIAVLRFGNTTKFT